MAVKDILVQELNSDIGVDICARIFTSLPSPYFSDGIAEFMSGGVGNSLINLIYSPISLPDHETRVDFMIQGFSKCFDIFKLIQIMCPRPGP